MLHGEAFTQCLLDASAQASTDPCVAAALASGLRELARAAPEDPEKTPLAIDVLRELSHAHCPPAWLEAWSGDGTHHEARVVATDGASDSVPGIVRCKMALCACSASIL